MFKFIVVLVLTMLLLIHLSISNVFSQNSFSSYLYNCTDFNSQNEAQAVYDMCLDQVGYDIHKLDSDGDNIACESLPLLTPTVNIFTMTPTTTMTPTRGVTLQPIPTGTATLVKEPTQTLAAPTKIITPVPTKGKRTYLPIIGKNS